MKLVTWKIRGMNKVYKQKEVRKLLSTNNISILALVEHKIKEQYVKKLVRNIAPRWIWLVNYDHSDRGRILVMWNPDYTDVTLDYMTE